MLKDLEKSLLSKRKVDGKHSPSRGSHKKPRATSSQKGQAKAGTKAGRPAVRENEHSSPLSSKRSKTSSLSSVKSVDVRIEPKAKVIPPKNAKTKVTLQTKAGKAEVSQPKGAKS